MRARSAGSIARKRDADASLFAIEVCAGRRLFAPLIIGLDQFAWSIWKLPIECLPISDTAAQELGGQRGNDQLVKSQVASIR